MSRQAKLLSAGSLIIVLFALLIVNTITANIDGFETITPENAVDLQIVGTLYDYYNQRDYNRDELRYFSANGQVIGTDWKTYDLVTGVMQDFTGQGYVLALNADGSRALVSGEDNGTRLVDTNSGEERLLTDDDAETAIFIQGRPWVVISSIDADAVQLWDMETLTLVYTLGRTQTLEDPHNLAVTPDGHYLFWTGRNGNLYQWDTVGRGEPLLISQNVFDFTLDNGTIVLRKSDFETVEIWDVESATVIGRVVDFMDQSGVDSYAVSPDQSVVAIAYHGGNSRFEMWTVETRTPQLILQQMESFDRQFLFTADSQYLMTNGSPENSSDGFAAAIGDIVVLDAHSGEVVNVIEGRTESRMNFRLSPDGQLLFNSGRYATGVQIWQIEGAEVDFLGAVPGSNAVISPDGSAIMVDIDLNYIAIYAVPSEGQAIRPFLLPGHVVPSSVNARALPEQESESVALASGNIRVLGRNADSTYVYVPDLEGWIRAEPTYFQLVRDLPIETLMVLDDSAVVEVEVPTTIPVPSATPIVTPEPLSTQSLDQLQLVINDPVRPPHESGTGREVISAENAQQMALLAVLPDASVQANWFPVVFPALSTDGTRLISPPTDTSGHITIWNLDTFEVTNGPQLEDNYSYMMAGSADGRYVAYTAYDYYTPVSLWSVDRRVHMQTPQFLAPSARNGSSLAFSYDGDTLAFPGGLLDIPNLRIRAYIEDSGGLTFSPDDRILAIMESRRVHFYDVSTGEFIVRTPRVEDDSYSGELKSLTFSPDSAFVAALGYYNVYIFDTTSGALVTSIAIPPAEYRSPTRAVFSPDGQYLFIRASDGVVRVLDTGDWSLVGAYDAGDGVAMDISPDGSLLALSHPLRLVDLATGEVTPVEGNFGGDYVLFSQDGSRLLVDSGSYYLNHNQSVMVFGVPSANDPDWSPISAEIVPSAINVRSGPDGNAQIIGTVQGTVEVIARDFEGEAVYLAGADGWVWSASEYIDLTDEQINMLPVRLD